MKKVFWRLASVFGLAVVPVAMLTGAVTDQCDIEYRGEPLEIGFNDRYLLDALQNTDCDEVRLRLNGPLSPLLVSPMKGSSFLFVVLPVRLKEANGS